MVPSSGDLHIIRADFSDTVENYACRVRNTLNNREEISPAFNLVINGEKRVSFFGSWSMSYLSTFPIISSDSGLPTKPTQLSQQDLFYSYRKDDPAVLTCNVQSTPPPAFR